MPLDLSNLQPMDYGSGALRGLALMPDFAGDIVRDQQLAINRRQIAQQEATLAFNQLKDAREIAEADAFERDFDEVSRNPSLSGWNALVARYPKQAEAIKESRSAMDEATEKADRTQIGSIFNAMGNGEWDLAADTLQQRIDADAAAGTPDPMDQTILRMIQSGDQVQRNKALGMIGFGLAAMDPDGFNNETYRALFPERKLVWRDNVAYDERTGQPVTQDYYGRVVTTPLGTENLGRVPGVPIAGFGVTPEGTPAGAPAMGPPLAQSFNPNAPSMYQSPPPGPVLAGPEAPGDIMTAQDYAPTNPLAPTGPAAVMPGVIGGFAGGTFDSQGRPVTPGPGVAPAQPQPEPPPQARAAQVRDFLVGNAKSAIETIFPGARVTDWRRDPNSKLGRANPNSYHNLSRAAVDVAPIPGMTFEQFTKRIEAEGYRLLEKRDEVTNPSGHATGPHWHTVLQLWPGRSRQEYDKIPPGGRYLAPDGTERRKGG